MDNDNIIVVEADVHHAPTDLEDNAHTPVTAKITTPITPVSAVTQMDPKSKPVTTKRTLQDFFQRFDKTDKDKRKEKNWPAPASQEDEIIKVAIEPEVDKSAITTQRTKESGAKRRIESDSSDDNEEITNDEFSTSATDESSSSDDGESKRKKFPKKKVARSKSLGQKTLRSNKKKRKYTHRFRDEWLQDTRFKKWIAPSSRSSAFFYCKCCNEHKKGGIGSVLRHARRVKHLRLESSIVGVQQELQKAPKVESAKTKARKFELRIGAFIVEHNYSFRSADHLVELIKTVPPDKKVLEKISCNRTKCISLVNNVLGKEASDDLVGDLRNLQFSLIIDESTDSTSKKLAITARLCKDFKTTDEFLGLLNVEDATASGLYNLLVTFFREKDIPYQENCVGFASDGASVMTGGKSGVQSLLTKDIPHLFVIKCTCHSLALCASAASKHLPQEVEDLLRDIYNYFRSSKRANELTKIQSLLKAKVHKILKLCDTRWLSHNACVKRVLEQWEPLKKLFKQEAAANDSIAHSLYDRMNNPLNLMYFEFLIWVLPLVSDLNREFQSESPKIHQLYNKYEMIYRTILDCYLKSQYVKSNDVSKIQYRMPSNFLPLNEIHLGGKCNASIALNQSNISENQLNTFRVKCQNYYVELAHQMFKRFPFNSDFCKFLKLITFMDPLNIDSTSFISPAASFLEKALKIDLNELDCEWRILRNIQTVSHDLDFLKFWRQILSIKKGNGDIQFPLVKKLVQFILTLPHSSAAVERIFSQININKTKLRNKLSEKTLTGILNTKNLLKRQACHCYQLKVTKSMLEKHKSTMYEFQQPQDSQSAPNVNEFDDEEDHLSDLNH